jgi:hypothetical protein
MRAIKIIFYFSSSPSPFLSIPVHFGFHHPLPLWAGIVKIKIIKLRRVTKMTDRSITVEAKMIKVGDVSVSVDEFREALKIIKSIQNNARQIAGSLKHIIEKLSLSAEDMLILKDNLIDVPFKTGDLVSCNWAGQNRLGIVIDPLVRFNNRIQATRKYSELACIIRFLSDIKPYTNYRYNLSEPVPHRCIEKVLSVEKGKITSVNSRYSVDVEIYSENGTAFIVKDVPCNEEYAYYPGLLVQVVKTSGNKYFVARNYDETNLLKVDGNL